MADNRKREELTWDELQQAVEKFIAADDPNTDDLSAEDFFAIWMQFDTERMLCVDIVESSEASLTSATHANQPVGQVEPLWYNEAQMLL